MEAPNLLPTGDFLVSSEVEDGSCLEERRFLWHDYPGCRGGGGGKTGCSGADDAPSTRRSGGMDSKFGKHQKNFSATKYIKP